jgi:hypothetical protein
MRSLRSTRSGSPTKQTLNGWLLLKNEEGKEGQASSIGDHKVYSIDGQQVTVLSATGGNQMQQAGVTLLLQGGCSGYLKKQYWEPFVVAMEDGYEQTLFQRRGKTMHRRRRNDRLIFLHESEEKGIALWRDGLLFQLGRDFRNLCKPFWMNVERRKFFWVTLFANVSQLKWIILKEPFEDRKYLGTHFKYQIKINLG